MHDHATQDNSLPWELSEDWGGAPCIFDADGDMVCQMALDLTGNRETDSAKGIASGYLICAAVNERRDPETQARLDRQEMQTRKEYSETVQQRDELRAALAEWVSGYDYLQSICNLPIDQQVPVIREAARRLDSAEEQARALLQRIPAGTDQQEQGGGND